MFDFIKKLTLSSIKFVAIVYIPSNAITCTNSNANQNRAAKVLFKYNMVDGKGYIIKLGVSGNLYYYGLVVSSNYVFFRKVTPIDTTIWQKIYQFKPNVYAFDLDSAETYMYSVALVGTSLNIVQVATADGSITKQVQTTSFKDSASTSVSISSDSSTIYISGVDSSSNMIIFCIPVANMNSAKSATFPNTMSIRYTLAIDSSNAYIAVKVTSSPNNYAIFRKLNFANSDVNVWANKIACPAFPIMSCNLYQSPSIIDSTGTILYNLVSYDSIVLFFGVNLSTGAVVGSSFQSSSLPNGACDDSETIYQYSTNIYMLVRCSTKYAIFTYSVSSSTFKDYKQTVFGTHFLYLTYRNGMLYFIGDWNSGSNTYTRIDTSPVNSLTTNANIVATTATMVALTSYSQNQVELLSFIINIKIF